MTYSSAEFDTFPELVNDLIKLHSKLVTSDGHASVPWYFCKTCNQLYPCTTIKLISTYVKEVDTTVKGCQCGRQECSDIKNQEAEQF